MNDKCVMCKSRKYPILRDRRCIRCIALLNEDLYKKRNPNKSPKLTADFLVNEYVLKNKSLTEVSLDCGITKQAVAYWLKFYEIPIRSISDSKKKRINSDFFRKINPDSAFLLGYIFTDGDLQLNKKTGNHFLRLYGKYSSDLSMVLRMIESKAKIQERKALMTDSIRQAKIYFIHIADETFIGDIMKYGMVRNKNSKIKFPKIPAEYFNHFIRGCWAGSGYAYNDTKGKLITGIVLASRDLIEKIEQILNSAGLKKRKIYQYNHTKTPSYYFRYSSGESLKLYKYLYKGASDRNTIKHQSAAFVQHTKI
jgi:hypothetical protein